MPCKRLKCYILDALAILSHKYVVYIKIKSRFQKLSYIVRVPVWALHVVLVDPTANSKAAFQNFVAILVKRWLLVKSDWDLKVYR